MSRRFLLPAAAFVLALALASPAAARQVAPQIVNGTEATQGRYPAQGYLTDDPPGVRISHCGGTLVGTRQFLTAANCVASDADHPEYFTVTLGEVNIAPPNNDVYPVARVDVNVTYDPITRQNDTAMLTLGRPAAAYEVTRVVDSSETDLWAPGVTATILGWGKTSFEGGASDLLREAQVPIRTDADCATAYQTDFDSSSMVCAGAADPDHGSSDSCAGDEGGPLLVPDGPGFFALAGLYSNNFECNRAGAPGIYARIGDDPLNIWVHNRTPEADFRLDHAPRANEPVTLTSTSRHPEGADYFTTFRWDLDNGGTFNDAAGRSVTHSFPSAGDQIVGLEASRAGGDRAIAYFVFTVGPDPNPPPEEQPPLATPAPPALITKPGTSPLATITAVKRPKVRRGHFQIRVKFAKTAPRGTAVVEVFRGKRIIGIARTRVRRGATKRVSVKLTSTGRRLLRRSTTKRLKVKVRVRVGRTLLRRKTLTISR